MPESIISPMSYATQDPNASMMYSMTSMDIKPFDSDTIGCDRCGALLANSKDSITSHMQRGCPDDQLSLPNSKKVSIITLIL